jgi:hypothetical protein
LNHFLIEVTHSLEKSDVQLIAANTAVYIYIQKMPRVVYHRINYISHTLNNVYVYIMYNANRTGLAQTFVSCVVKLRSNQFVDYFWLKRKKETVLILKTTSVMKTLHRPPQAKLLRTTRKLDRFPLRAFWVLSQWMTLVRARHNIYSTLSMTDSISLHISLPSTTHVYTYISKKCFCKA